MHVFGKPVCVCVYVDVCVCSERQRGYECAAECAGEDVLGKLVCVCVCADVYVM